jgi:hypothetical protein
MASVLAQSCIRSVGWVNLGPARYDLYSIDHVAEKMVVEAGLKSLLRGGDA